jgi:hypothetical protein
MSKIYHVNDFMDKCDGADGLSKGGRKAPASGG